MVSVEANLTFLSKADETTGDLAIEALARAGR
uniref:Uncharacterized protein n=1 Tax=Candidozyma auris TaxID=498019 RepID=A0A0L0P2N8_CANAR